MLFNSWSFAAFMLATFLLYYLPQLRRFQVGFLVMASFVFYSWTAPMLLLLLLSSIAINTITSYVVAGAIGKNQVRWAAAGVVANLMLLGVFKYGGLLTSLIVDLFGLSSTGGIQVLLHIPLPIGVSFYTFEGISLLVDVSRMSRNGTTDRMPIVRRSFCVHLSHTSLFIAFFPHLIAGPILKARQYYPQIGPKHFHDIPWESAFRALVTGYFLKVVVADNLNSQTTWLSYPYYKTLSLETGAVLLVGYSMQIFADFAGYSLIAIGLAAMFGYDLPVNFSFPYVSRSLSEFWRRWHISLSTWLRDYLYFSLGGNRLGAGRTYFNLMTVMVLGGLWHGAAWSYAVWGAYHGFGLAVERFFTRAEPKEWSPVAAGLVGTLRIVAVFAFVTAGWLLFKLPNFSQVQDFICTMVRNRALPITLINAGPVIIFCIPVIIYHALNLPVVEAWRREMINRPSRVWRASVSIAYALMLFMIVFNYGSANEFIYFQF